MTHTVDIVVAGAGHNSLITAAYLAKAGYEVVVLDQSLVSPPERPLRASVVAVDRLRDVDATELLQRVIDDPLAEDVLPRPHERLGDRRDVKAHGLRLGPRRAVQPRVLHIGDELGIDDRRRLDIADPCHRRSVAK